MNPRLFCLGMIITKRKQFKHWLSSPVCRAVQSHLDVGLAGAQRRRPSPSNHLTSCESASKESLLFVLWSETSKMMSMFSVVSIWLCSKKISGETGENCDTLTLKRWASSSIFGSMTAEHMFDLEEVRKKWGGQPLTACDSQSSGQVAAQWFLSPPALGQDWFDKWAPEATTVGERRTRSGGRGPLPKGLSEPVMEIARTAAHPEVLPFPGLAHFACFNKTTLHLRRSSQVQNGVTKKERKDKSNTLFFSI